jgi:methylenetetrahydrofolate dehydrogenase (NADP+)/methenyltetrahydrofolate cyclohydrolase
MSAIVLDGKTLAKQMESEFIDRVISIKKHSKGITPILAMMFLNEHATVTICHSRTQNLPDIVRRNEVVVGAVGKPEFIKGDWISEGAIVIDAGFHPEKVGDIELSAVVDKCAAYTPVPGGVGPMTIATLIAQTVEAAEKATMAMNG